MKFIEPSPNKTFATQEYLFLPDYLNYKSIIVDIGLEDELFSADTLCS